MRRVRNVLEICAIVAISPIPAIANEPKAPDYAGISYLYYFIILGIVGWGLYDTFFRKS